jgi:uncharacterized protein
MPTIQVLCHLQDIDREWDEKARLYQSARQQLADNSDLEAQREAQRAREHQLAATRGALRDVELKLKGLQAKLKEDETTLYSGRIRIPKELEGLRQDSEQLKKQISQLEDQALTLMTQVDELQQSADRGVQELQAFEAQKASTQEALTSQVGSLRARLKQLQEAREQARSTLGRAELVLYDELRATKGGLALAPMKASVCQVCRVSVPALKARNVGLGEIPVTCEGCGRILYLVP